MQHLCVAWPVLKITTHYVATHVPPKHPGTLQGFEKTGLGERLANLFVRAMGKSSLGLAIGLNVAECLLAPAMPSTSARAGVRCVFMRVRVCENVNVCVSVSVSVPVCMFGDGVCMVL
jgi:hypothetical protein